MKTAEPMNPVPSLPRIRAHVRHGLVAALLAALAPATAAQSLALQLTPQGQSSGQPAEVAATFQLFFTQPASQTVEIVLSGGVQGTTFGVVLGAKKVTSTVLGATLYVRPDLVMSLGQFDPSGVARILVPMAKKNDQAWVQGFQIDTSSRLALSEALEVKVVDKTPTSTAFSRDTAKTLMQLAYDVYEWSSGNGKLHRGQQLVGGFRMLKRIQSAIPDQQWAKKMAWPDTQLMLARNPHGDIAVVFRGTDPGKAKDWATDVTYPQTNGIHSGFLAAAITVENELSAELKSLVNRNAKVFVTGHSLGAALAPVSAYRLQALIRTLGVATNDLIVYGFGGPRAMSPSVAASFGKLVPNHFLVANKDDMVTHVPLEKNIGYTYSHIPRMQVLYPRQVKIAVAGGDYTSALVPGPATHLQSIYQKRIAEYLDARPKVGLSVSGSGYMRLHWSWQGQSNWGTDQVQLFQGDPTDGGKKLNWVLATSSSPNQVGQPKAPNLHAAYVHFYGAEQTILATWGPYTWSKPSVSLHKTTLGLVELRWAMKDPGAHDLVALFDKDPRIATAKNILASVAATRTSRSVVTARRWKAGLWAAYIERATATEVGKVVAIAGPTQ